MKAVQEVLRSDGSSKFFKHAGRIQWWSQPGHHHFHYLGFMTYELRRVDGYKRLRPAQKGGFCLMDDYDASDWDPDHNPPGKPPAPVFTENCRPDEPDALTVDEGISVGYGDYYNPLLEGQSIDLTGVPDGRYDLVILANKTKSIRESTYKNNGASVELELSHPSGPDGPPAMTILATCRDSGRCPAG
jgi:lysyl oxidase